MRKHILLNLFLVFLFGTAYAQGPVMTGLLPQNNATSVSVQPQLQISFDVNVQKGEGEVVIKQWGSDAIVEAIDVNSEQVAIANATVTVNPSIALSPASGYYITIEEGAFENLAGEPFAGIADNATWSFTTSCGSGPIGLQGLTTTSSAILEWEEVPGAIDYQVWISDTGLVATTNGEISFGIGRLPSGHTFDWTVKYKCAGSEYNTFSDSSFSKFKTKGVSPCATLPTGLGAEVTKESATLTWNAVAGVTYDILVNGLGVVGENISGNTYELTGLTSSTTYSFTVRAVCAEYLKSEWSEEVSFATESCATVPTGLVVSDVAENSVVLSWNAPSGVDDCQVWISNVGMFKVSSEQYILTGLAPGITYNWGVRSLCDGTASELLFGSDFTTMGDPIACVSPSDLNVVAVMDESATFTWEPIPGVREYQVWISNVGTFKSKGESFTHNSLAPGTTYSWGVKTFCVGSTSDFAYGADFTTTGVPNGCGPISSLEVNAIDGESATLAWDPIPGVRGYQVWISDVGMFKTNEPSYTHHGLVSGTNYSWGVRALCVGSVSELSFGDDFSTTGDAYVCDFPDDLEVGAVTERSATFTWTPIEGVREYQVWISGVGMFRSSDASFSYTGLEPSTTYSWGVRTLCVGSISDLTFGDSFTTDSNINFIASENGKNSLNSRINDLKINIETEDVLVNISLYPNPTSDEINISLEGNSSKIISSIVILNQKGYHVMAREGLESRIETIRMKQYGQGLFLVKVIMNNGEYIVKKVFVQ